MLLMQVWRPFLVLYDNKVYLTCGLVSSQWPTPIPILQLVAVACRAFQHLGIGTSLCYHDKITIREIMVTTFGGHSGCFVLFAIFSVSITVIPKRFEKANTTV